MADRVPDREDPRHDHRSVKRETADRIRKCAHCIHWANRHRTIEPWRGPIDRRHRAIEGIPVTQFAQAQLLGSREKSHGERPAVTGTHGDDRVPEARSKPHRQARIATLVEASEVDDAAWLLFFLWFWCAQISEPSRQRRAPPRGVDNQLSLDQVPGGSPYASDTRSGARQAGCSISSQDSGARFLVHHLAKHPFKDRPPGAKGYELIIPRAQLTAFHWFKEVDVAAADRNEAIDRVGQVFLKPLTRKRQECVRQASLGNPRPVPVEEAGARRACGRCGVFLDQDDPVPGPRAASPAMPAPTTATLSL